MEFDLPRETSSIIKVIGVGGGGSNAVNHMYNQGIIGVDFIVCNTDRQALDISPVPLKIQLGPSLTEGRGAGAIPEIGMNAAIENIEEIRELLSNNTKMVFVTAGLGGGTGTGAAPVIAQVAKELGILTVGIVTVPFNFEGRKRRQQAEDGLEKIRESVDTLLIINNEKLREITGNLSISNAFSQADDVLSVAAKGIAEVISVTGAINVDFNDVNTVMKNSGVAIMGSASAAGEDRALTVVQEALNSPLLNDNDIKGAKYVLLNITYGDAEVTMDEIAEITDYIQDEAGSTADVIWGHGYDATLGDKLSVTIIATGFKSNPITGFEKAPEKKVTTLDEEPKKEIVAPLASPTQESVVQVVDTAADEPFLVTKELTLDSIAPAVVHDLNEEVVFENVEENEAVASVQSEIELTWDLQQEGSAVEEKVEVKKFFLEDDTQMELTDLSNTRTVLSPEDQQKRAQERIAKIQEYTMKLKKADGIAEFENEPAFVRRNVQLDETKLSEQNDVSRFSLNKSGLGNNSFLHDNVD